jgi:hypothetical protein
MKRQARNFLATSGLIAISLAVAFAPAPATAAGQGSETFNGVLLASGATGSRIVLTTAVVMRGVFNGVGRIVEVPNLPTDPDNVNRDDLVFADGAIHFVNTGLTFSFTIDPRTCIGKLSGTQSIAVVGGTGRFAHATGGFAGVLAASAIAPRNVDGTCDVQSPPLLEVDHVSGTGSLSF